MQYELCCHAKQYNDSNAVQQYNSTTVQQYAPASGSRLCGSAGVSTAPGSAPAAFSSSEGPKRGRDSRPEGKQQQQCQEEEQQQ
jgi:hypothetical protein